MRKYLIIIIPATILAVLAGCTLYTSSGESVDVGSCWLVDPDGEQVLKIASDNDEIEAYNDIDVGRPISVVHNPYNDYTWVGDADGRVILLTGRAQMNRTIYGFDEPSHLALFPKEGSVWVLDTGSDRVVKMGHRGELDLQLDSYSDGRDIAVDPVSGEVFVAQADRITRLDYQGEKLDVFNGFTDIAALEYDGARNRLWALDSGAGTFIRMKNDGTVVETVSGQIDDPRVIAINQVFGYIYVGGILDGDWILGTYILGTNESGGVITEPNGDYSGVKEMREGAEGEEDDFFGAFTIAAGGTDAAIWINDYENHRLIKAIDNGKEDVTLTNIMGGFFAPSEITVINGARR
ncbi:MAG: hypothetical protein GY771_16130 [bacterium]|nr:hypothetical protein [bacterium]